MKIKGMKKVLGLLPIATLGLTSCVTSTYDVIIAVYGEEYIDAQYKKELEEATGLKIKTAYFGSNEELERMMETQHFDIVNPSEYMAHKLADKNLLQKISYDQIGFETREKYEETLESNQKNVLGSNIINSTSNENLTDYFMPYTTGDLRFMVNKNKSECLAATNINPQIKDTFDLSHLISRTINEKCRIGVIDDARVIAMLAANINAANTANDAVNPSITDDLKETIGNMKDAGIKRIDDGDIGFEFAMDKLDIIFTWNTTPLWVFDDSTKLKRDDAISLGMGGNTFNNLWIDGFSVTSHASISKSMRVLKAIYDTRTTAAAVRNVYNSVYIDVENQLKSEINDPSFAISSNSTAAFSYKLGNDLNYNDSITKAVEQNWI